MQTKDFDTLMAGLGDVLAYAEKKPREGTRERKVEVTRTFVAETRAKAGLTQAEFAKVTGASLGKAQVGASRAHPVRCRRHARADYNAGAGACGGGKRGCRRKLVIIGVSS